MSRVQGMGVRVTCVVTGGRLGPPPPPEQATAPGFGLRVALHRRYLVLPPRHSGSGPLLPARRREEGATRNEAGGRQPRLITRLRQLQLGCLLLGFLLGENADCLVRVPYSCTV
eukprot:COSAG01_NODE_11015_length_2026_cov_8.214323_3_plen_114_part_00